MNRQTDSGIRPDVSKLGRRPDVRIAQANWSDRRTVSVSTSIVIAVSALAVAEALARKGLISSLILPAPSAVLESLWFELTEGLMLEHIRSTLGSALVGFLIAAVVAMTFAGILASVPFLERVMIPFVVALQSLPKVAVAPLIIIWLGFGDPSKTTIVVITCFFPILVNSLQGFRLRDRDQLELMLLLGASRWQIFRYIRLPSALPHVFSGLHIGVIFAMIGAVVAEFISADRGLGFALLAAQGRFDTAGVFAVLIVLMAIGMTLNAVMNLLEKRLTFWARDMTSVEV